MLLKSHRVPNWLNQLNMQQFSELPRTMPWAVL